MATSRTGPRRRRRGSGTAMGVGDELDVRVVPCSFDGDQAGSYLGALEANRTLHAIYALDNGTVTLDNLSNSVAFLLRADIRRGTASGQELSGDNEPQFSIWQDNDIKLFPGEWQTLTVTWNSADLQGARAVVSISGWNLPKFDILV